MARHRGETRHHRAKVVAGLLATVVVLGVGGAYAALRASDDNARPASAGSTTTTSPSPSGTSTSAPTSTATTDSAETVAREALEACTAQVRAQERLAAAAAASARNWDTHTEAQLRLDRGAYTRAQAEAIWASTQERGPRDVKEFEAATVAVKAAGGPCTTISAPAGSTPLGQAAASCVRRSAALAAAAGAGAVVNAQWAAHLEMMADKPHTDRAAYRDRWVRMVKAAQPALSAHQATAKKLSVAPPCG